MKEKEKKTVNQSLHTMIWLVGDETIVLAHQQKQKIMFQGYAHCFQHSA